MFFDAIRCNNVRWRIVPGKTARYLKRETACEHAFGNALDIASFTLANGRVVTVKDGWRGAPEEQGFLRDVQMAACRQFATVLAPGSNRFHYDHMHVDLMRRGSGESVCNPEAIPGEIVAARAAQRGGFARRRSDPLATGSIEHDTRRTARQSVDADGDRRDLKDGIWHRAVPGED